jgi:hypothetical protein
LANLALLAISLASLGPASQGVPSFLLPEGTPYTAIPEPAALLLFRRGPHPVCAQTKGKKELADACSLHAHLSDTPLRTKTLQPLARRVLATLKGADQALLRARLLGAKARRTQPCLQIAGAAAFAGAESRMILSRQRDALQAYGRALKSTNRKQAGVLMGEIVPLVRLPYDRLASQMPATIIADLNGTIDLLPPRLIIGLRRLARSVGYSLSDQDTRPIRLATKRREESGHTRLWREGEELLIHSKGSLEPLRLRGDAAAAELEKRLTADDPDVARAAELVGVFGFSNLAGRLVFLSEIDDPKLSRVGWIGRTGLARAADHNAIVKWLLKTQPEVTPALARALRRFSNLAGNRIKKVLPSQWPLPILSAMVSHSTRFDQRVWYTALLEHKDPTIKVLAHAAMRKTKPEEWLTARLDRVNRCAANHLRILMPSVRPVGIKKPSSKGTGTRQEPNPTEGSEPLPEDEEISDQAGSVVVPEGDDSTDD